jgi:hypothetical protein
LTSFTLLGGLLSGCAGTSPAHDDGADSATGTAPECPGDDSTLEWDVLLPLSEWNEENDSIEVTASCTVITSEGDDETGSTLELVCDELDGMPDQALAMTFGTSESPLEALPLDARVDVHYTRWVGFEVTSGHRLSIVRDGEVKLVALRESADGGVTGHCADPADTHRAAANAWLDIVDARLEPGACAGDEDEGGFHLARTVDGSDHRVYPGELGDLGENLRAQVGSARCLVEPASSAETWDVGLVVWAG